MSIVVRRSDNREYEFRYADLPRLSLNDVEDMYFLKVQDKLYNLKLDFEIDFINALRLLIRRYLTLLREQRRELSDGRKKQRKDSIQSSGEESDDS
ncbi:hypothetical protein Tco_1494833 [Tanacetum coccineum]